MKIDIDIQRFERSIKYVGYNVLQSIVWKN